MRRPFGEPLPSPGLRPEPRRIVMCKVKRKHIRQQFDNNANKANLVCNSLLWLCLCHCRLTQDLRNAWNSPSAGFEVKMQKGLATSSYTVKQYKHRNNLWMNCGNSNWETIDPKCVLPQHPKESKNTLLRLRNFLSELSCNSGKTSFKDLNHRENGSVLCELQCV